MPWLLCLFAGASRLTGHFAAAFRFSWTGTGERDSRRRPAAPTGARLDHRWRAPGSLSRTLRAVAITRPDGMEVQLVTSAVRPIPEEWSSIPSLHLVVSIDGLASEHDRRRAPATYDRILKHIAPHRIIVHCTVTRPMLARAGYLSDFCRFWSDRPEVRKIWFSIYTPQEGDSSAERLRPDDRDTLIEELSATVRFPKVHLPRLVIEGYRHPPRSPAECAFARLTTCLSADLKTHVTPCQLGGKPVCEECGCMASAGMHGLASLKLGGLVPISAILNASIRVGGRSAQTA